MRARPFIHVFFLAVLFLFCRDKAAAVNMPTPPAVDIYLAEYVQMVNAEDRQQILDIGKDLDKRFGAQIVVVAVNTLDGADIETYANTLFRSWGIGSAEKNNGVLLLIAKDDRKFRIEVGYGLEGAITDGYAGEVLDAMKPKFRDGDYSEGILTAYKKLASKVYEEYGESPPESLMTATDVDNEWSLKDFYSLSICLSILLIVSAIFYFVISIAVEILLSVVLYVLNVLLFIVSFGKTGNLNIKDHYKSFKEKYYTPGSGGSRGRWFRGFRGGRSGGGGASGGW
ncbi:MAG: TPM domain-containing protein [Desulfovibrio sp.]|nr:TPM domain-containing protein [Desulfovibrio sp.]